MTRPDSIGYGGICAFCGRALHFPPPESVFSRSLNLHDVEKRSAAAVELLFLCCLHTNTVGSSKMPALSHEPWVRCWDFRGRYK